MAKLNKVEYLVVHHSAGAKTQTIEDIKQIHIKKGYVDIGYHKVIDPDGDVHQGRADAVIGAQAFGANAFSMGICCIGNYDIEEPNESLVKSLIQVLATLCKRHKLSVDKIIGHRDVATMFKVPEGASACPGKFMYAKLPYIRQEVQKYIKK